MSCDCGCILCLVFNWSFVSRGGIFGWVGCWCGVVLFGMVWCGGVVCWYGVVCVVCVCCVSVCECV